MSEIEHDGDSSDVGQCRDAGHDWVPGPWPDAWPDAWTMTTRAAESAAWLAGELNLCPGCADPQRGTERCTDCLEWDAECRDKAQERGDE